MHLGIYMTSVTLLFVQDICLKDMIVHIQRTKNHDCYYGPVL